MSDPYRVTVGPRVVWEGAIEEQKAIARIVVKPDGNVICETSFGLDAMGQVRWNEVPKGWEGLVLKEVARALVMRS